MGREMAAPIEVVMEVGTAETPAINKAGFTKMVVYVPTGWTAASMGFKVSSDYVNWYILRTEASVPVQITTVIGDRAYQAPSEVEGARFVKLWSKHDTAATETDIIQVAAMALTVDLTA